MNTRLLGRQHPLKIVEYNHQIQRDYINLYDVNNPHLDGQDCMDDEVVCLALLKGEGSSMVCVVEVA